MSGYYRIVEAQRPIVLGLAGHDLIAVLNPSGQVIQEFDGLATSANGQIKPIGYLPSDTLHVYPFDSQEYYNTSEPQSTLVAATNYAQLTPYINAMTTCMNDMNALNLSYPFLGLGANSNSVASTMVACMGVPEPSLVGSAPITPGVGTLLLSPTVISNVATSNGLGQPPPQTGDSYVSGTFTSGTQSTVTVTNGDGTTEIGTLTTFGSDGEASISVNDTAANRVYTQTNIIQPDGTTTVSSTGHGNAIAIDGATISEPGQNPSSAANSFTNLGDNDIVNVSAVDVGKLGSPDGGTVIFGANTNGEVVNATGGGGVKITEGADASAVINGGENGGSNQVTLSTGDNVLDNGWDIVNGGGDNTIDIGANDEGIINDSGSSIVGKTGDTIDVTGTDDHIYADSSDIIINGADTGDIVYGSGDTGSDWGGYVNEGGSYGGYPGGGYYYDFAAARKVRQGRESRSAVIAASSARGVDIGSLASTDDASTRSTATTALYSRLNANANANANSGTLITSSVATTTVRPSESSAYLGAQQLIHAMSRWPAEPALQSIPTQAGVAEQQHLLASNPFFRPRESAMHLS
jgi:hypothetical protein